MPMRVLKGANVDALTNCYSKENLVPTLEALKTEFEAYRKPFSVLLLDIDHFKQFNDKYGHLHGDEVLKYFSSSLHLDLEEEDNLPFRFGGDEFVVLFPSLNTAQALRLAGRLQKNIKTRMFLLKGKQYLITFSGGLATCPTDGEDVQTLLDRADKAMYFSKKRGRGGTTAYSRLLFERIKRLAVVGILIALAVSAWFFFKNDRLAAFRLLRENILKKAQNSIMETANRGAQEEYLKIGEGLLTKKAAVQAEKTQPIGKKEATKNSDEATAAASPDEVYLKTGGGALIGKIVGENDKEIEMRFDFLKGEGSMVIKKSDIVKINRSRKQGTA